MAELPFTDTHVHFHELGHPELRYDWLEPEAPPDPDLGDYGAIKARHYRAEDFLAETRLHNIDKVIHVQAAIGTEDPVAETRWLQEAADRTGAPHGIVAHADLASPDARAVLERHLEYPNTCGIRDLRYDDYLTNDAWISGFAALEELGLVCCDDPLLEHMPAAAELAGRFPGVTLCIDHAGFPRERSEEYFRAWRGQMRNLASAGNTVVKISGLGQCDHAWTVDSMRPWVLACVEAFGVERSFFGTNWPVDRLFSSYGDVVNAYAEIISEFSDAEQRALFSDNAKRVFGIE
jgi:predicted TIM-barrel fold metal-dependent hydrolase